MKKITQTILVIAVILFSANVFAQPPGNNWGSPKFADEFEGNSLDTNKWSFRTNGAFRRNNIEVSNGTLKIKNKFSNQGQSTGAWITSKQKFGNGTTYGKYGYYEAQLRIDGFADGDIWPTWWIWGGKPNGKSTTEFDLMEFSGNSIQRTGANIATTSHHYDEKRSIGGKSSTKNQDSGGNRNQFQWHRWGMLWTPNEVSFWYDGVKYMTSERPGDAAGDKDPLGLIFSSSPHIIDGKVINGVRTIPDTEQPDNRSVGREPFPGQTLPSLEVRWVRFWSGGNPYPNGGGNNNGGNTGGGTVNIPGTLEAENGTSLTGGVRVVDIPGNKKALGYIKNNTSSTHSINVPTSRNYAIDVYASSGGSGGTIDFFVGNNKLGVLNVPKTNGWNDYKKVSTSNIFINAGLKTVRLVYKGSGSFLFNVDGLVFRNGTAGGGNNNPPPPPANTGGNNNSGAPIGSAITIKPVKVSWVPNTFDNLSARFNQGGTVRPNVTGAGEWEKFVVEAGSNGNVRLKVKNFGAGFRYLTTSGTAATVNGTSATAVAAQYKWTKVGNNTFRLQSVATGKWLQIPQNQNKNTAILNTNGGQPGAWELFSYNVVGSAKSLNTNIGIGITINTNPVEEGAIDLSNASNSTYSISSLAGEVVKVGMVANNSIDVSSLTTGLYIVQFEKDGKLQIEKIIIK